MAMPTTAPTTAPTRARGTRIGRQILLGAAVALVAAVLIAVVGAIALLRATNAEAEVVRVDAEQRFLASDVGRLIAEKATAFNGYLASRQDAQLAARDAADTQYRERVQQLQELSRTPEARRLADQIVAAQDAWSRAQDGVLAGVRDGTLTLDKVPAELTRRVIPLRQELFRLNEAAVAQQAARIEKRVEQADGVAHQGALMLAGMAVLGVGGAVASSVAIGRRLNARLDPVAQALDSAAAELVAGTSQQVAASAQTRAATQETLTTVEELVQTAQDNANRAREVADQAHEAAEAAERGHDALTEALDGMGEVRDQVQAIALQIVALADQARDIESITGLVDDLAEQTHLLALNASIEAARAGEHGRGFSVVAAEVRDLAEQAKKANAQIGDLVAAIRDGTNTAVLGTEEGIRRTGRGTACVAEATGAIAQLAGTVVQAATAAEQIAASSGQQAVAMNQIGLAMRDIEDAATQNLAASRQAEETGRHLSQVAGRMRALIGPG